MKQYIILTLGRTLKFLYITMSVNWMKGLVDSNGGLIVIFYGKKP